MTSPFDLKNLHSYIIKHKIFEMFYSRFSWSNLREMMCWFYFRLLDVIGIICPDLWNIRNADRSVFCESCSLWCWSWFSRVLRSSRTILQSDVVPQSHPGSHLHSSDWLGQRPLHTAMGTPPALHPGTLCWRAPGRRSLPQRLADRWLSHLHMNATFHTVSMPAKAQV